VRKEGYKPFVSDLVLAPGIARTFDFKLVDPKDVVGNSPPRIATKNDIKLLIVAGGSYQAGTDRREQGRRPNEGSHKVTLARPFYMGEREITNAQFRQFQPAHNSGAIGNVSLDLDKQPVVRVTWDEAASSATGCPPRKACRRRIRVVERQASSSSCRCRTATVADRGGVGIRQRAAGGGKLLKYPQGQDLPVVSGTGNLPAARPSACWAWRWTGTRMNSRRRLPRRCSRPMPLASTTSLATCQSGSQIVTFLSSPRHQ
jgi:hypothetical protein